RLLLRLADEGDVAAIARAAETASTTRISASVANQVRWWQEYRYGLWVLTPHESGQIIGWCGLKPGADPAHPEIMFGLEAASRGQGLATEAARSVVTYALALPGVSSVWGATVPTNAASVAVLRRIGMSLESEGPLDGVHSLIFRVKGNGI
ncbi:MAG: GNAT family N-acetyltransferase, partial [Gammaproteobacteria bacterium]|nr:GNAT family N-acetyltransferase [Gammaproteobacteria bacterium]